jgi:hypothetical protein
MRTPRACWPCASLTLFNSSAICSTPINSCVDVDEVPRPVACTQLDAPARIGPQPARGADGDERAGDDRVALPRRRQARASLCDERTSRHRPWQQLCRPGHRKSPSQPRARRRQRSVASVYQPTQTRRPDGILTSSAPLRVLHRRWRGIAAADCRFRCPQVRMRSIAAGPRQTWPVIRG